jgi:serine phosphatase RsbU (regulator of sigma subunit)/integral membrane sensor domain MASE1/anti-sigma regulatory factor (Ser/Thr protein kinase)
VLLVGVAAAYYLGARLGLALSLVQANVTPLWPPTGIAVAAFLLFGRRLWPAVAVAALAVNLPITAGVLAAGVTAVGNTVAPLLAVTLLRQVGFRQQLDRNRDALAIVFLGALASMLVSATVGAATLALSGAVPVADFPTAWLVWWTGDAMGVLVVTPFLLSLPLHGEHPAWTRTRWLEAVGVLGLTSGVTVWATSTHLGVLFLVLPVLGYAAWRLQLRGAAPAALVVSLVATWAAVNERGPFAVGSVADRMVTLQAFNASVALTSLILAAVVTERMQAAAELARSASLLEDRVRRRTADLTAANRRLVHEIRERTEAEDLLSHEEARSRREHEIAEMLQRRLLPSTLPEVPGLDLTARYVPATSDVQVGGDWYDVVMLPGGLVGLAIGDVAGHGLAAASTMGQVRMAFRAYALQDPSPAAVLAGVHRLLGQLDATDMVTMLYALYDPTTRRLRYASAGHPPAVLLDHSGTRYLRDGLAPPVGVTSHDSFTEATAELPPDATLVMYTDGLVERRGESLDEGLDRLARELAPREADDLDDLCDHLLAQLLRDDPTVDDVALLVVRPHPRTTGPLRLRRTAEARRLPEVRHALRWWLRDAGVSEDDEHAVLVACGEACTNVVQHAYSGAPSPGEVELVAHIDDDVLTLSILDRGSWRPVADRGGGWGLQLMDSLMESVAVDRLPGGTEVRMTRRVDRSRPR